MACVPVKFPGRKNFGFISFAPVFKARDPAPEGYLDWHEWAKVQIKAGLRQDQCGVCGLWRFPQELSDLTIDKPGKTRGGLGVTLQSKICKKCAKQP